MTAVNFVIIFLAFAVNHMFQVFCRPSGWAGITLFICSLNLVFYRGLKNRWMIGLAAFINGIACSVLIYCIVFLGFMNWAGFFMILVFGFGLITYIPHFLIFQIVMYYHFNKMDFMYRQLFYMGISLSLFIAALFGYNYYSIASGIACQGTAYLDRRKNFMTEKIGGMHIIYHTRICVYDGWRPPIHEPALIIGTWFTGIEDPLPKINLDERIRLYKKLFPANKIKQDCSCADEYRGEYFNSPLFKD